MSEKLEPRVARRSVDAKDSLKALYKAASSASSQSNIAAEDPNLARYVRHKADIRCLLNYYSEELIKDAESGNRSSESLKLDQWLIDFEKEYSLDNDGTQDVVITTKLLLNLAEHKERALLKIIAGLRSHVKHDMQQLEQNLPAEINICSKDLHSVFHFVKTIKFLIKVCASAEMKLSADAGADVLEMKERIITELQKEAVVKDEKIMDLKAILVAGESDSSRFHALNRQQERILSLESQLLSASNAKDKAESYLKIVEQSKSAAHDQTALVRSQLKSFRANYDRDVAKLRPLLEEQVRSSQLDLSEVRALHNDTTLHVARLQSLQKQLVEMKQQLLLAQLGEKKALTDTAETKTALYEAQSQNAKLVRMQTVVVAAKITFQEKVRILENLVTQRDKVVSGLQAEAVEARKESDGYRSLVEGLRREVQEKQMTNDSMRDQLNLWRAEAASEHIATSVMRKDLNEILATDSASFREDYVRISEALAAEKETSKRLNKQLKTAMQRIYELQGQLLTDKSVVSGGGVVGDGEICE